MFHRYLCRELLAFFKGSLKVHDGLSNASKFWEKIADKNGKINSNYGHYVFHIQLPEANNQTQYDWVVSCFREDLDTRQALVNISQINHKTSDILDFHAHLVRNFT
ncbi:thymidylate synthase [Orientia tsutsugamushi]|uniref:thymidylate synthase n=1 Tax=Orientia tsutsugamushi TaxID=784 RepID=UPI000D55A4BE